MQNASTIAKSSGRTQQQYHTHHHHHQQQQKQQISLVIIRIELDDLNLPSDDEKKLLRKSSADTSIQALSDATESLRLEDFEIISSTDQLTAPKLANLTYNCRSSKTSDEDTKRLLDEHSEKFGSQEKALDAFIGKRESKFLVVETYYIDCKSSEETSMSRKPHPLGNNAMTMQTALETAYSDWNKKKSNSTSESALTDHESSDEVGATASNKPLPLKTQTTLADEMVQKPSQETDLSQSNLNDEPVSDAVLREEKLLEKQSRLTKSNSINTPESLSNAEEPSHSQSSLTSSSVINPPFKKADSYQTIVKTGNDMPHHSHSNLASSQSKLISIPPAPTLELPYYYGNPTVDIFRGLIHIYKDSNLTSIDDLTSKSGSTTLPIKRSEMLCILGIPASLTCNELLNFVMPAGESLQYVRVIRDSYPNRYMAVLKFKTQKDADVFYNYYNNREFNSIEEHICHLAFVERIELMNSSKGGSLPIPGFTELPTCYICLERMDESLNGVITILCNHSFHASCLSKWGDTCCPVCRYSQTPEYSVDNTCSECGSHENLWICLICGNVGCGRYVRAHAYDHFKLTQHTYAMELGHNRVWDYVADNYVHRLIQNKTDGKLVQLDEGGRAVNQDEKFDSITLEYTYLLTSQLESQRLFFEDHIDKIEQKSKSQIQELEAKAKKYESENTNLRENLSELTKEKNALEKKCTTLNTKLTKMQTDLEEEKELNKLLASNQEAYQSQLSKLEEKLNKTNNEKENEIKDLQSQLRDVMFYLDSQAKFNDSKHVSKEELQESHMIIQQDESQASGVSASAKAASRRKKKK